MRRNELIKTKYDNIYTFESKSGETQYFLSFELNSKRYQRKNITKLFGVNTITKAKAKLEEIKTLIRSNEDPFSKNITKETVKEIIKEQIANKKAKYAGKDNSKYKESLNIFYDKYIDDVIGHLKFSKIATKHIKKILKNIEHLSNDRQGLLKVILYNEFEVRFRNKEILENPLYSIEFGKKSKKEKLDIRLNESLEEVVQKLYKTIIESDYRTKLLLLINLMCARRIGEVYELTYGDIKKDDKGNFYILAHPHITKTSIYEKYPIPSEVIELLPDDIFNKGSVKKRLFDFHKNTIYLNYKKLIEKSKIDFNNDFKITTHDSRNIFITLLVKEGFDSELVDACLSHSKSDTKNIYLEVEYEKRREIFEEYWKIIRSIS
jgi:integrase